MENVWKTRKQDLMSSNQPIICIKFSTNILISAPYHLSHGYLSVALCVCEQEEHALGIHGCYLTNSIAILLKFNCKKKA